MPAKYNCCIVFSFLCFILGVDGGQKLRIGVERGMDAAGKLAVQWANVDTHVDLVPIQRYSEPLEYDRIITLHSTLESLDLDAILSYFDRELAVAAAKLDIPYMVTSLSPANEDMDILIDLLPRPDLIARALLDLTENYTWKRFAVLYEDSLDPSMIDAVIDQNKATIKFWRIPITRDSDKVRQIIRDLRDDEYTEFMVLTSSSTSRLVFHTARSLGIIARPFSWIVLNMGGDDITNGAFKDLRTNVTTMSLVDNLTPPQDLDFGYSNIFTCALMHDSIIVLYEAHTLIRHSFSQHNLKETIKTTHLSKSGLTGNLDFNSNGDRVNFTFNFHAYDGEDFKELGVWQSSASNLDLLPYFPTLASSDFLLKGRTVDVVTILEHPFTMYVDDHEDKEGNDKFYGFAVDMMDEISAMLDFKYNLYVVPDGNFGAEIETGAWNGMIGEVLEGRAAMTMAPLSINAARENVVDFTKPFKTRGITVLMKTPTSQPRYFEFLSPLSYSVWLCCFVALLSVSALLCFMEKYGKQTRQDMPRLNHRESAWFIFGSMVQGSTESTPVTLSGRLLTSAWWFFGLILISTYTANLAAFLTVKKIYPPISSVTDLVDQSKIRYGTVRNSGVMSYFANSNVDPFRRMWTQMSELGLDDMVDSTAEGLRRVQEENYAFLWDSTVNSYVASTDCDYTEIGPPFDPKGFGIAVPPGAIYRDDLSLAILRLADQAKINEFEHKWWESTQCHDNSGGQSDETTSLELENVAGIFFVLLGGVVLACIALAFDRLRLMASSKKEKYDLDGEMSRTENVYTQKKKIPNHATAIF